MDSVSDVSTIKAHFAWTLAHLAESLVFYSVTMYSDGQTPNLTKFSSELDSLSTSEFITSIGTLSSVVNSIFPDSEESMSVSLFKDLETVNSSIEYMGDYLPSSIANGLNKVTASIDESLNKIQETNSEVSVVKLEMPLTEDMMFQLQMQLKIKTYQV